MKFYTAWEKAIVNYFLFYQKHYRGRQYQVIDNIGSPHLTMVIWTVISVAKWCGYEVWMSHDNSLRNDNSGSSQLLPLSKDYTCLSEHFKGLWLCWLPHWCCLWKASREGQKSGSYDHRILQWLEIQACCQVIIWLWGSTKARTLIVSTVHSVPLQFQMIAERI